jgi:hypothetical protein
LRKQTRPDPPKPTHPADAAEFLRLMVQLRKDITEGHDLYHLYRNLCALLTDYQREIAQSRAFWSLVLQALQDSAILRLCRVYDQDNKSLSLHTFLHTFRDSPEVFHEAEFRKRLATNPSVERLVAYAQRLPAPQLDQDVLVTSDRDPLVHKLILWRHKAIAHRDYDVAKGNTRVLDSSPFTGDDWLTLIDRSFDILNRYAFFFDARSYSTKLIGEDDYRNLFHFLRLGLKKHDEDLDAESRAPI